MSDPAGRSYRLADIKKLFALSYNSCALPGCEQRLADQLWPLVMAEICHIYGLRSGSARYVPGMSEEELNAFENLLLLCRNCHQKVDKLEFADYPAERLLQIKEEHESCHNRRVDWCPAADLDSFIAKLVLTLQISLNDSRGRPRPKSDHQPGMKIRLYELAREMGVTNSEALQVAQSAGIRVQSHSSSLDWAGAERIRDFAWDNGLYRQA